MNTLLFDTPRTLSPLQLWLRDHGIQITRSDGELFIWRTVGVHVCGHVIEGAADDEEALKAYAALEDLPTWHQPVRWGCGENDFTEHELKHLTAIGEGAA